MFSLNVFCIYLFIYLFLLQPLSCHIYWQEWWDRLFVLFCFAEIHLAPLQQKPAGSPIQVRAEWEFLTMGAILTGLSICFTRMQRKKLWWKVLFRGQYTAVVHKILRYIFKPCKQLCVCQTTTSVQSVISQQLLDGLPLKFAQLFVIPSKWIITLDSPWIFI